MEKIFPEVSDPELFFGFVAPVGAEISNVITNFRESLKIQGYDVIDVKVTDTFEALKQILAPTRELRKSPADDKYESYISYGNQLREHFDDDAILAAIAIIKLIDSRRRFHNRRQRDGIDTEKYERTAYLLHQFKRKEEIELLRAVYGRLFFQVSVYSRRGARVASLAKKIATSRRAPNSEQFRSSAERIVQTDADEVGTRHGQRVGKIFHDADFIVSADRQDFSVRDQVLRFVELLFSSNAISPTRVEFGLFSAKTAALRSLDLSRQVGAAIFSTSGEIVSMGCNEVPQAGGGTYWSDDPCDHRDYKKGFDSNFERKRQLADELLEAAGHKGNSISEELADKIRDSQFMDALEYGRMVHAEMAAITSAAMMGRSTHGATLYCTTFPCHMCAKHIVASGIKKVVFLEPYPKSLVTNLHSDSIVVEGAERAEFSNFPSVEFEHFFGVSHRRFRQLFERGARKDSEGAFLSHIDGRKRPNVTIRIPFYARFENDLMDWANTALRDVIPAISSSHSDGPTP